MTASKAAFQALMFIALPFLVSDVGQAQAFSFPDVPWELRDQDATGTIRKSFQEGVVSLSARDQSVTMNWSASPIANAQPDFSLVWDPQTRALGNNVVQTGAQTVVVRYYPTAACVVDNDSIVVAGVDSTGETVIEVWALVWPSPMPTVQTNIQTGLKSVAVAMPSVGSKTRIYDASVPGRNIARNLCGMRRQTDQAAAALVQFYDSTDIYAANLTTGALSLVASASSAPTTLGPIADLGVDSVSRIWCGDKISQGYVYVLRRGSPNVSFTWGGTVPNILVLIDADRNGAIDSYLSLDSAAFVSQGLADLGNYNLWWRN